MSDLTTDQATDLIDAALRRLIGHDDLMAAQSAAPQALVHRRRIDDANRLRDMLTDGRAQVVIHD